MAERIRSLARNPVFQGSRLIAFVPATTLALPGFTRALPRVRALPVAPRCLECALCLLCPHRLECAPPFACCAPAPGARALRRAGARERVQGPSQECAGAAAAALASRAARRAGGDVRGAQASGEDSAASFLLCSVVISSSGAKMWRCCELLFARLGWRPTAPCTVLCKACHAVPAGRRLLVVRSRGGTAGAGSHRCAHSVHTSVCMVNVQEDRAAALGGDAPHLCRL